MKYKIHYEPIYDRESRFILENIIGGKSIKDEMEESILERGVESMRRPIESIFQPSLELERFIRENICLTLPGYEKNGREMAEFLFKKWKLAEFAPIEAVEAYDILLGTDVDNKALAIILVIGEDYLENNVWGLEEVEAGNPPPKIEDSRFFDLINSSYLEQDGKLGALNLYYNFDEYRLYAHALYKHIGELLRNKIGEYTKDIKSQMDFADEHLLSDNAARLKEIIDFGEEPVLYHIHPGIYKIDAFVMKATPFTEPYIIVGMGALSLRELYSTAQTKKAAQFLKCLSDGTKQAILQLLRNESFYGTQLADKLNCTGANISQHMSALISLGVVRCKKVNNRLYFSLNREMINQYLDTAKELFA